MTTANGIDHSHDPAARCWVPGAMGHPDFPVQNLPLGLFSDGDSGPRAGVAIGDFVFDLAGALDQGLLPGLEPLADLGRERLNEWLALGREMRLAVRHRLFALFTDAAETARVQPFLVPAARADLHLPCDVGDYTDFYAGIHHATRIGRLFRPDAPLLPNYRHVPIGYHGRASSVVISGTPLQRPSGQLAGPEGPRFAPTERLDFELELGVWLAGGNALGSPLSMADASEAIAGVCLLNDWSARDIQAWEYQPLGPFLAKNFLTSLSPWIITPEALAPFRTPAFPRADDEPRPLAYLMDEADQAAGGLAIDFSVTLETAAMRAAGTPPEEIAVSNSRHLYWTIAQLVAHHASGGCNLRAGDLIGTGTISGPEGREAGSLMELTEGGRTPIRLASGEDRRFLEAGDRLTIRGHARRPGAITIGLGACVGEVIG